jgi:flagellar hook assembly protein FlgD/outer membrane protein OmpA-like peptidoglycan-associated protein
MKKKFFILFSLIFLNISVFSTFRTPESGRYYYWLFSPDLLSRGIAFGANENPSGIIINPASNSFVQRLRIEASYGLSPGFWSEWATNGTERFSTAADFFLPFIINVGIVIPSKYGNFTIYTNYMNMSNLGFKNELSLDYGNNNELNIGKIGSIYFNFSKDYNDNFAFGFNGNMKFSYNPNSRYSNWKFDIAGGFDFGFIFRPDWFYPRNAKTGWAFQDPEFSIILKDVGKPLINTSPNISPNDDIYWFPAMLTPTGVFDFDVYNDGSTFWKHTFSVSAPFFQNLTLSYGTEIQIYKFLVLRGSYTFDLEGVLEYTKAVSQYEYLYMIANCSFGMSFKFRSDFFKKQTKEEEYKNRAKTTEFSIDLGARPFAQGFIIELGMTITLGVKDTNPPVVTYIQHDQYMSPNLDGVKDNLVIDLNIKDERYVTMWKMEIYDEKGNIVKTIIGKEQRPETMKAKDIIKKYFSPKSGIPIPKQVTWDGKDDKGNPVPDGKYTFKFFAMDDNKNINKDGTQAGTIIVKTDKPEIKSDVTNPVFSPNSGGTKEKLIIDLDIIKSQINNVNEYLNEDPLNESRQKIDVKKTEKKEITNLDMIEQNVMNTDMQEQKWYVDILDSTGKVIKSFNYNSKGKKKIEWDGKDNNGNNAPDGVYRIKLYSTDMAGNYFEDYINNIVIDTEPRLIEATTLGRYFGPGNGVKENIGFKFNVPITKGVVKWQFDISTGNKIVKTFTGEGMPPAGLTWDGKNDANAVSTEGDYKGKLTVFYENGNQPYGITPVFTIDMTPPKGDAKFSTDIFRPNGSGYADEVTISQTSTTEDQWNGIFTDENGKTVKTFTWKGNAPKQFTWDGKDDNNKLLQDGQYYYQIASTDAAGNSFKSEKKPVKIFTQDTPVFITATYDSFNPASDKNKKQIFEINSKNIKENKVISWELVIKDEKGSPVFNLKKDTDLPKNIDWDGKANSGQLSKDGNYLAELSVKFQASASNSKTKQFSIDTTPPSVSISASSNVFSPNNDDSLDNYEVKQSGTNEDQWHETISSSDGTVLWEKYYSGKPVDKESWDGKDKNGNIAKNGTYKYVITATDKAGNTGKAELNLELKNIFTKAVITLENDKFSARKDSKFPTLKIRPYVNYKDDLDSFKIDIMDKNKKVVRNISGTKTIPELVEWDGKTNDNTVAPDGYYTAKLSASYKFGNKPEIESSQFILDSTPPEIDVRTSPEFFSPDEDGVDDELKIDIKSSDLTGIAKWKMTIMTPDNKFEFKTFNGIGKPADQIIWDGKSDKGEIVESAEDYPLKIYAEDAVGNFIDKKLPDITTDILVIRLPDGRLKIKISNINFKPDSSQMTDSPKNEQVLNLLSRKLKKFGSYKITVEGHANKFIPGNYIEDIAKRLSKDRAVTVVDFLNKNGINKNRMIIEGKGGEEPIFIPSNDKNLSKEDQDRNASDLEKNRRVEFYLDKNQ